MLSSEATYSHAELLDFGAGIVLCGSQQTQLAVDLLVFRRLQPGAIDYEWLAELWHSCNICVMRAFLNLPLCLFTSELRQHGCLLQHQQVRSSWVSRTAAAATTPDEQEDAVGDMH